LPAAALCYLRHDLGRHLQTRCPSDPSPFDLSTPANAVVGTVSVLKSGDH
jgi:hypothetical protein